MSQLQARRESTVPSVSGVEAAAIRVADLEVTYRRGWRKPVHRAVQGLSFEVRAGETVGFIGPNGAGKSSTIKSIMGFLEPSAGQVELLGEPAGSPEARKRVGFLPEVAIYSPWLTPFETLWMHGRLAGVSPEPLRGQIGHLLARVGLSGRERDRLRGFSKGMLQRVGIAQALLGDPALLVLDEVSSGLDPLGRRDLRDLLLEEKRKGTTIFFSSHELSEVAQLCDRVLLVKGGRVADEQVVADLLRGLRRYWVRFSLPTGISPERLPATRDGDAWEAEFPSLVSWRQALDRIQELGGKLLDAGEREGALEEYFVNTVSGATARRV